jgi:hypothetical protein
MRSKRFILALVFVSLFGTSSARAGGIPVIDAASIAESVKQYLLLLQEYSELVSQTGIETQQLVQLIDQYSQTLREYQHYLNQIKALRYYISEKEWQQLMRDIDMYYRYYGKGDMSTIPTMNRESSTYESDVDEVLRQYGYTPRDPREIEAEARALGIRSSQMISDAQREWLIHQKYKDQMSMVSANEAKVAKRDENIAILNNVVKSLPDASDLATLHLMATQSQIVLNQLNDLIGVQNQQMLLMESPEELRSARRAEARDRELKRLREREPFQGGKAIQKWGGY